MYDCVCVMSGCDCDYFEIGENDIVCGCQWFEKENTFHHQRVDYSENDNFDGQKRIYHVLVLFCKKRNEQLRKSNSYVI